MAGLISTGIWGFLTSAKATGKQVLNAAGDLIPEWVSTFVSGASGWLIDKLGNAEFKSVYVRDKFITNEFVYNRIKVTEDEEIISSSGKILSAIDNGDGTSTVFLDLREGDFNPFATGDLVMGYYHSPGNTGVIYSVQKFTLIDDPSVEDQSMIVVPEDGCIPYQHMIIVRIGNEDDIERQSFIRISSKTNCQYFYDGINSWAAYEDPEHVRCALGKADIGLIPGWAVNAIGGIKNWFGLIADGVILRGTFILHNDKTIEDELNGREIQLRGDFQIREDGITGKWEEVIKYADDASDSAANASESATSAGNHVVRIEKLAGEFSVNAEELSADFSEKVTTDTTTALGAINTAKEEATGSLQLTARDFTIAFAQNVETKTTEATGAITTAKENAESDLQLSAKGLTATFNQNVETKTTEATGAINTAKVSAESSLQLTASNLTTTFEETVETSTIEATGKLTTATESHKSELNATAKELSTKFEQSITDAEGEIVEQISTQVTQNAKQWKVEVMGSDADGNPNKILASINASEEGIKISGDKVEITGTFLAQIIMATGLNIGDKFLVTVNDGVASVVVNGEVNATSGVFKGRVEIAGGKTILKEDGTGQFASGSIYWDEAGRIFQKGRTIPIWRDIYQEMIDMGIDTNTKYSYDIDLNKGTYLDVSSVFHDMRTINLPASDKVSGVILDLRRPTIGTRELSSFIVTCKDSKILQEGGPYPEGYDNVRLRSGSGTITSKGTYWFIEGTFDTNVEIL